MNCREAIEEVFASETGVLTTRQVIDRIYSKYSDKPWKENTISAHLIGLSVNHPTSRYYPSVRKHAFLFSLGNGRYRRWNQNQDGTWIVTEQGVVLQDSTEEAQVVEQELELGAAITSLSLEQDLRLGLVTNLERLETGLRLYNEKGVSGQELDTGVVGRIDILAVDKQGDLVVVELKAGKADDRVYGQILRYMGWVAKELAGTRKVRGIIVANEFSDGLMYASKVVPDVSLKKYDVRFDFKDIS